MFRSATADGPDGFSTSSSRQVSAPGQRHEWAARRPSYRPMRMMPMSRPRRRVAGDWPVQGLPAGERSRSPLGVASGNSEEISCRLIPFCAHEQQRLQRARSLSRWPSAQELLPPERSRLRTSRTTPSRARTSRRVRSVATSGVRSRLTVDVGSKDLAKGSVTANKLAPGAVAFPNSLWGPVLRNQTGAAQSNLQTGPGTPPMGEGSLALITTGSPDLAAFGDSFDFAGFPLDSIDNLSYSSYNNDDHAAGEALAADGDQPAPCRRLGSRRVDRVHHPDLRAGRRYPGMEHPCEHPGRRKLVLDR